MSRNIYNNKSLRVKSKNKWLFFVGVIIYRILLDYLYINQISIRFSYTGLTYSEDFTNYCISWLLLIPFLFAIIPFLKVQNFFISNIIILLFLLRFVPFTSFIANKSFNEDFLIVQILFWGFILFFVKLNIPSKILHRSNASSENELPNLGKERILKFILIISCFVVIFVSGVYAKFRLHLSLGIDVYDLRLEARNFDIPVLLRYLLSMAKNILPLLFVYYWEKKKIWICNAIAFVILLNFSINGLKTTLFLLFLCIILQIIYNKKMIFWYPALLAIICFISIVEFILFDITWISDTLIRRILFIPSLLDSYYYDYISQTNPLYYQQGDIHFNFIIGDEYFGKEAMNANNGLFSDAYMNLGFWGIIIYPLIYAIFFRFCELMTRRKDERLVIFAVIVMVSALIGSTFTTSLLTHGLLAVCLIFYLLPTKQNNLNYKTLRI